MEVTFQVNNQKFGISKHRFIQSDTHILQEDFEDTKGVILIRKSKKNRQRRRTDNKIAKRKRTKDKQRSTKHIYKTKDRVA